MIALIKVSNYWTITKKNWKSLQRHHNITKWPPHFPINNLLVTEICQKLRTRIAKSRSTNIIYTSSKMCGRVMLWVFCCRLSWPIIMNC